MFIFLINLIATKQSHIHDAITKRLLRQQDHLLKIKLPHVPRNDAAVVRFVWVGTLTEERLAKLSGSAIVAYNRTYLFKVCRFSTAAPTVLLK